MFVNHIVMLSSSVIQKEPGIIVGPITTFLGYILNFIFEGAYALTERHSLGISIVILTIFARVLMLPISFKQQKSMLAMQRVQPDMEKIKAKYGSSKDPEMQQKMNAEIQQLYAKNKVNPLSGCLPLFVTFPIFIALNYLMNQSYVFISKLDFYYRGLATKIMEIPDYVAIIHPIAVPMVPAKMQINLTVVDDLMKCLNKFTMTNWNTLLENTPPALQTSVTELLTHKQNIEYFLGINLVEASGYMFPGILIPIFAGITTYLSSWIMMRNQKTTDKNAKTQQQIMLVVMPIMMGFMTINMPAGVGVYWIVSSLFQMVQMPLINKYYSPARMTKGA